MEHEIKFQDADIPMARIPSQSERHSEAFRLTVGTYRAALIGSAPLMPVVATLITIALYIAIPQSLYSKPIATAGGFVLMLFVWLIIAAFFAPSTTAVGADMHNYNVLSSRLERLITKIQTLQQSLGLVKLHDYQKTALEEMDTHLRLSKKLLAGGGSIIWVSGIGYVNLSRLLNRAEENLILVEPVESVIADGSRIGVTLENTQISNKDFFRFSLERSLDILYPGRIKMVHESSATKSNQSSTKAAKPSFKGELSRIMDIASDEAMARTTICEVTRLLNEFQDNQWEKLIHARNQLRNLITMTGLVLLLLLEFAILVGFSLSALISATFFFLIGAGIGLFSRLYEQAKVDSSIDDVRLAGVRLMAAPLFSGLAGIGGVVVMQKVVFSSGLISFDLTLFNILVAAAFGLAPNLFFSALRRQVASVERDKNA